MKILALCMVLLYLSCCLLLFVFQRSLLYYPTQHGEAITAQVVEFNSDGTKMLGWLVNPGQSHALVYYGGNAEPVEASAAFFEQILPDYSVYLIPYRGYWPNNGEPRESLLYSDALNVFDNLKNRYQGISVIGRSLGSGIATFIASKRDVDRLVLVTPFDSLVNVAEAHYPIFPVRLLLKDKYESYKRTEHLDMPTLVVIASEDRVIPRIYTDNLIASFKSSTLLKSIVLSSASHNNLASYPEYGAELTHFLSVEE